LCNGDRKTLQREFPGQRQVESVAIQQFTTSRGSGDHEKFIFEGDRCYLERKGNSKTTETQTIT
jgi:hypothetical protein